MILDGNTGRATIVIWPLIHNGPAEGYKWIVTDEGMYPAWYAPNRTFPK